MNLIFKRDYNYLYLKFRNFFIKKGNISSATKLIESVLKIIYNEIGIDPLRIVFESISIGRPVVWYHAINKIDLKKKNFKKKGTPYILKRYDVSVFYFFRWLSSEINKVKVKQKLSWKIAMELLNIYKKSSKSLILLKKKELYSKVFTFSRKNVSSNHKLFDLKSKIQLYDKDENNNLYVETEDNLNIKDIPLKIKKFRTNFTLKSVKFFSNDTNLKRFPRNITKYLIKRVPYYVNSLYYKKVYLNFFKNNLLLRFNKFFRKSKLIENLLLFNKHKNYFLRRKKLSKSKFIFLNILKFIKLQSRLKKKSAIRFNLRKLIFKNKKNFK